MLDALAGQQAQLADHASYRPRGEGSAGEADQDDLIPIAVVGAEEGVGFPDPLLGVSLGFSSFGRVAFCEAGLTYLGYSYTEGAAAEGVEGVAAGSDAGLVRDDLQSAVVTQALEASRNARHVGGVLQGTRLEKGRFVIAIIAWDCEKAVPAEGRKETLTNSSKYHHST